MSTRAVAGCIVALWIAPSAALVAGCGPPGGVSARIVGTWQWREARSQALIGGYRFGADGHFTRDENGAVEDGLYAVHDESLVLESGAGANRAHLEQSFYLSLDGSRLVMDACRPTDGHEQIVGRWSSWVDVDFPERHPTVTTHTENSYTFTGDGVVVYAKRIDGQLEPRVEGRYRRDDKGYYELGIVGLPPLFLVDDAVIGHVVLSR